MTAKPTPTQAAAIWHELLDYVALACDDAPELLATNLREFAARLSTSNLGRAQGPELIVECPECATAIRVRNLSEAEWVKAAERLDADIRDRLLMLDGGPELLSWEQAHRHHADEPYIGCVFCRDEFAAVDRSREPKGGPVDG